MDKLYYPFKCNFHLFHEDLNSKLCDEVLFTMFSIEIFLKILWPTTLNFSNPTVEFSETKDYHFINFGSPNIIQDAFVS